MKFVLNFFDLKLILCLALIFFIKFLKLNSSSMSNSSIKSGFISLTFEVKLILKKGFNSRCPLLSKDNCLSLK